MLDGWYCRSMANMQADGQGQHQNDDDYSSDSSQSEQEQVNYKLQYNSLKKKLKYLIYENECFQDILRSSQKRLLKASRDRSFLLDRLLQYEKPENSSSDSDETDSSEDHDVGKVELTKKRRIDTSMLGNTGPSSMMATKPQNTVKRKRQPAIKKNQQNNTRMQHNINSTIRTTTSISNAGATLMNSTSGDGHMTPEEVERHLQSRQTYLELLPERAPPTVPTEMFSNDPSLDSESNDILENSPCNIDDWVE